MQLSTKKHVVAVVTPLGVKEELVPGASQVLRQVGQIMHQRQSVLLASASDRGIEWITNEMRGDTVVAFSPGANKLEQETVYRLDTSWAEMTVYTGASDPAHIRNMLVSAEVLLIPCFTDALWQTIEVAVQVGVPVAVVTDVSPADFQEQVRQNVMHATTDIPAITTHTDPASLMQALVQIIH